MDATRRWRAGGALLGVALSVLATLALAIPAAAHETLESTTPQANSTVQAAPTEVTMSFSDVVQNVGLGVVVTAPDGATVQSGDPKPDGPKVTQALRPLTAPGWYTVAYRTVSSDGHPVSGEFAFTVVLDGRTGGPKPSATDSEQGAGTQWGLIGIGVLVMLAGAVALALRRPT